ncbi:LacI family DNA-binding transcriptional regulator [Nitratireductor kimnyeongensis]|uniref:LacI family DNA-binding transcriptional regulator n=1 Tax=Nitratireductor kimnyeongensis TaxID=430679 RepID=A0ABW0T8H0_9HYPH|nr:LacI family DNA-binding transcriptional regulator [Nitratireductor kimnyeongensis]QZZ36442.1 LacI family transcriptional regulator [Nitratireductor kimnyeongensis]
MAKRTHKGSVTIKDIVAETGYSLGTVSRALNGKEGVRPGVKKRVEEAARSLGYRPNLGARAMRSKNFGNVAFLANMSNIAFTRIAQGAQGYLKQRNYSMSLCHIDDEDCISQIAHYMGKQQFDGVMLSPNCEPSRELSDVIISAGLPHVLINRVMPGLSGGVIIDYYSSVAEAMDYLIDLGHRGILIVGGSANILPTTRSVQAYRDVRRKRGLDGTREYIACRHIDERWGTEAVQSNLDDIKAGRITAILSLNNTIFIGVLKELRRNGVTCPADVSLVSFEDGQLLSLLEPPITAIVRPLLEVGVRAAERLVGLLGEKENDEDAAEAVPVEVRTHLVKRESCGPARRPD